MHCRRPPAPQACGGVKLRAVTGLVWRGESHLSHASPPGMKRVLASADSHSADIIHLVGGSSRQSVVGVEEVI